MKKDSLFFFAGCPLIVYVSKTELLQLVLQHNH